MLERGLKYQSAVSIAHAEMFPVPARALYSDILSFTCVVDSTLYARYDEQCFIITI